MPSVSESLNQKPPLGSQLAQGVMALSANQQISFSLYQSYIFPLDGMRYWIKVPSSPHPITSPGTRLRAGLASSTAQDYEAIQVVPGGLGAQNISGGQIINPKTATEPLFVDPTGPAYSHVSGTTKALQPGESYSIPANPTTGVWVNAATGGHAFTVVVAEDIDQVTLPTDVLVMGSFHYDSAIDQRQDAVVDVNNVIFTSLEEIQEFNEIGPNFLYVAHYRNITFAFSYRGRLYEQADLYHYQGKALFSVNATQIIDDINTFEPDTVVSNSLPIWLGMNDYVPPYPGFQCPFPLFSSHLVPDNLPPPFGSVHIDETETLAQCPYFGQRWRADQLCRDKVIIHVYGANNRMMSDFRDFVEQFSADWNTIGMAHSGPIEDQKHMQPELQILAQRKLMRYTVNYYQSVSRDIARQLIKGAKVQNQYQWYIKPPPEPKPPPVLPEHWPFYTGFYLGF